MERFKRVLVWLEFTLALFGCIYLARAFVSGRIVALVVTEANLTAIALVAAVSALVPGVPLGIAYGVTLPRPILGRALTVAVGASVLELAFATYSVNWWEFVSWWVLPLECATLVICVPAAAWAGAAAFAPDGDAPALQPGQPFDRLIGPVEDEDGLVEHAPERDQAARVDLVGETALDEADVHGELRVGQPPEVLERAF